MQSISRIVHHDHQSTLVTRDELDSPADLGYIGRRKDVAADSSVEQAVAYKAGMGGLVA